MFSLFPSRVVCEPPSAGGRGGRVADLTGKRTRSEDGWSSTKADQGWLKYNGESSRADTGGREIREVVTRRRKEESTVGGTDVPPPHSSDDKDSKEIGGEGLGLGLSGRRKGYLRSASASCAY